MIPALLLIGVGIFGFVRWWDNLTKIPKYTPEVERRFGALKNDINNAASAYNVPPYILYRIGLIESAFDTLAVGSSGELGTFQITTAALSDFNRITGLNWEHAYMIDPFMSAYVASWLIKWHINHYGGDIEKAVKAYNTGRGGIKSFAAMVYWGKFKNAGKVFSEGVLL